MTTLGDTPTSEIPGPRPTGGQHAHGRDPVHYRGCDRVICAKSEYLSLTGSIKAAWRCASSSRPIPRGFPRPPANTGIAFAALVRVLGRPVKIFTPDCMSQERVQPIRSYGAEIVSVSKKDGGFLGSIRMCEGFAASPKDVFLPRQF
jgi:cysteine synthase